jgi:hypothetical protein
METQKCDMNNFLVLTTFSTRIVEIFLILVLIFIKFVSFLFLILNVAAAYSH